MFNEVKVKLAMMFTLIVAGLQFLFSFGFLLHQMMYYGVFLNRLMEFAIVLTIEIVIISILTFIVGYFFVKETMKPAEDMFNRLDQFTIDASHELKTPLGIANSSLDLALRTRQYKKYIDEAKSYIKKANNVVEKMLELARLDSISMTTATINLNNEIERILKGCMQEIKKKNLTVDKKMDSQVKVKGDLVLIERCISNLLENAIKFNKMNGMLVVKLSKSSLKIGNTGETIPSDDLERIFDRFFQSDISRSAKGYGIGLAIVKKICDLHGWKIKAESAHSVTTFTILF